jgi:hypothetical protein
VPWEYPAHPPREGISPGDIQQRFATASAELTKRLQHVWHDPPGLSIKLELTGNHEAHAFFQQRNTYGAALHVVDEDGLLHFGTGLRWMLAFLAETWDIENSADEDIVVFDEPANHLHPSAQKRVALYLNELAKSRQVIYATHSPFLIDWRFPYRIRVLRNAWDGQGTEIDNTPYASKRGRKYTAAWDEVRRAVGATFGDVVHLGEMNILVEGLVDQVLMASVCERGGEPLLDLSRTSIVPFQGCREELRRLLDSSAKEGRRSVVVVDSDQGGNDHAKVAREEFHVPVIQVADCMCGARKIEDLVAAPAYVEAVNQYYGESGVAWFSRVSVDDVARQSPTTLSIVERINTIFSRFPRDGNEPRDLDKAGVAILLAQRIDEGNVAQDAVSDLTALLNRCKTKLAEASPDAHAARGRQRVTADTPGCGRASI